MRNDKSAMTIWMFVEARLVCKITASPPRRMSWQPISSYFRYFYNAINKRSYLFLKVCLLYTAHGLIYKKRLHSTIICSAGFYAQNHMHLWSVELLKRWRQQYLKDSKQFNAVQSIAWHWLGSFPSLFGHYFQCELWHEVTIFWQEHNIPYYQTILILVKNKSNTPHSRGEVQVFTCAALPTVQQSGGVCACVCIRACL